MINNQESYLKVLQQSIKRPNYLNIFGIYNYLNHSKRMRHMRRGYVYPHTIPLVGVISTHTTFHSFHLRASISKYIIDRLGLSLFGFLEV